MAADISDTDRRIIAARQPPSPAKRGYDRLLSIDGAKRKMR